MRRVLLLSNVEVVNSFVLIHLKGVVDSVVTCRKATAGPAPGCAHFCHIWPWPRPARGTNCLCLPSPHVNLRHPAASVCNDRAGTALTIARCDHDSDLSQHTWLNSPLFVPPFISTENGWGNRRPRCWQWLWYVQSWLCRRRCSSRRLPLHCWTPQTSGTLSSWVLQNEN